MFAYVYRGGRIQFGRRVPKGAVEIAHGPAGQLKHLITGTAERDDNGFYVQGMFEGMFEGMPHSVALSYFAEWLDRVRDVNVLRGDVIVNTIDRHTTLLTDPPNAPTKRGGQKGNKNAAKPGPKSESVITARMDMATAARLRISAENQGVSVSRYIDLMYRALVKSQKAMTRFIENWDEDGEMGTSALENYIDAIRQAAEYNSEIGISISKPPDLAPDYTPQLLTVIERLIIDHGDYPPEEIQQFMQDGWLAECLVEFMANNELAKLAAGSDEPAKFVVEWFAARVRDQERAFTDRL